MKFQPREPQDAVNYSREHPLRETAGLFFGLSAAALAAYFLLGWAAELAVPWIPARWEHRIFSGLWTRVDGELAGETAEAQALGRLVDRLSAAWPDAPYEFEVGIIEEPSPNALALPGGRILVTRGLFAGAGSENELAFVLGHELGHFRNRDHLRSLGRGLVTGLLTAALGASTGVGGANPLDLARTFSDRGFGRSQERDADAFALELVHALYGHVAGADNFFERLEAESGVGKRPGRWRAGCRLTRFRTTASRDARRLAVDRGWPTEGALRPLAVTARQP